MPSLVRKPIPIVVSDGVSRSVSPRSAPVAWRLDAPAKVNLFLEILGKREDGFHAIETVMAPLTLADRLTFVDRADSEQINLRIGGPMVKTPSGEPIPSDGRNLVVRALEQLLRHTGESRGADLLLQKRVPAEAGLGGGSSDAAAALLLANQAWGLRLPSDQLHAIAAGVGSDVPYFLQRGAAICRGRGELVDSAPTARGLACVVAKPSTGLSTAEVYRAFTEQTNATKHARDFTGLLQALSDRSWQSVASNTFNRLEAVALQLSEPVRQAKEQLRRAGRLAWMMTGSGSAFFAFAPNLLVAKRVATRARQLGLAWATATHTA